MDVDELVAVPPATVSESRVGGADFTVSSYFAAFGPAPGWEELVHWPPDVFALANLVLDHTEGYRFVVAPPPGRRWPERRGWGERVRAAGRAWAAAAGEGENGLPSLVADAWETVVRHRNVPLATVRSGQPWELCEALLTLHAAADEACAEVASSGQSAAEPSFEGRAWGLLRTRGTLARLSPTRIRILPKTHFSARGITIRSLSRYLALCFESVELRWRSVEAGQAAARREFDIVLLPWPLEVGARAFRPAHPAPLENMDTDVYGFFEFAPESSLRCDVVGALLDAAHEAAERIDAVVLPEAAVLPREIPELERTVARHDVSFVVAGVREPASSSVLGRNYLHFGVRTAEGWDRFEQDKHHRWCLDGSQIRQYHLTRSLDPTRQWWEAIDIRERMLQIVDVGGGITTAPLVCEDLARLDEVADVVRRVGPSLVVALLLDGPQIGTRWPCRYASILADDPGAAVLTLTSFGMAALSRPPGATRSRVVAHWNDRAGGVREIALAPRASAILLSVRVEGETLWTADGRCHRDVPALSLTGVRQLYAPRTARRVSARAGRPAGRPATR